MTVRAAPLAVAAAALAAACGAPAGRAAAPAVADPGPPPAHVVAVADVTALAADATYVYWADDDAVWRRPHGPGERATALLRLADDDDLVRHLAVGRDDVYVAAGGRVLAIPRAGGDAVDLATLDVAAWALAADPAGDGVVVGVDDELRRLARGAAPRAYALPAPPTALAVADGAAYVSVPGDDAGARILRIDLARGELAPVADLPDLADPTWLAVSDRSLVVASAERTIELPRAGGAPRLLLDVWVQGLAADADGAAVMTPTAVVAFHRGDVPRLAARAAHHEVLGGDDVPLAVGGPYAYYSALDAGDRVLRAAPRRGPVELWRLPADVYPVAMAVRSGRVLVAADTEDGPALYEVGPRGVIPIAALPGWPASVSVYERDAAVLVDSLLLALDRDGRTLRGVVGNVWADAIRVHGGHVYWSDYTVLWAMPLAGGAPFVLADLGAHVVGAGHVAVADVVFAGGYLYAPLGDGEPAVARVDERGRVDVVWRRELGDRGESWFTPTIARIEGALFVGDGDRIWRVPLDGGTGRVLDGAAGQRVVRLLAAGGALIALAESAERGALDLIHVPLDGGAPALILPGEFLEDGLIVAADALYVYDGNAGGVLRIPAPAPGPCHAPGSCAPPAPSSP